MDDVRDHHQVESSARLGGYFLDSALPELNSIDWSAVEPADARGDVDRGDPGVGIGRSQTLRDRTFSAAHLEYRTCVGNPCLYGRHIIIEVDVYRTIGFGNLVLEWPEGTPNCGADRHHSAPASFARKRGSKRSLRRVSRRK